MDVGNCITLLGLEKPIPLKENMKLTNLNTTYADNMQSTLSAYSYLVTGLQTNFLVFLWDLAHGDLIFNPLLFKLHWPRALTPVQVFSADFKVTYSALHTLCYIVL